MTSHPTHLSDASDDVMDGSRDADPEHTPEENRE